MATLLEGPRIAPRRGQASALVVLLHGYGANGEDLIALGDAWSGSLPRAVFVAPDAPRTIPGMVGGLEWFPLTLRNPHEYWRGVRTAEPLLHGFLDAELARYRLAANRLVLVGFSQGSMLALHVGLRRPGAPAGIVAYSGLLAGPEHLAQAMSRPPVLLVHGEADDLIPVAALEAAREALAGAGTPVEWHVRPGLGHGIDPEAQRMGGHFIRQVLAAP
jgi:phospholipase/carboxylesterase